MNLIRETIEAQDAADAKLRQCHERGGEIVRWVMNELGYTQRALAEILDSHHTYINKLANGKEKLGVPLLRKLLKALSKNHK